MNAKTLILLAATVAALFTGCPPVEEPHIILGTWDYIEDALDGYIRWDIKLNGTIEQTDLGHGILAGDLTWVLTGPNEIRISQDNGANQWLLEGTIYSEDYMAGTWMQVAGDDTGTHGTWTAYRFP
jgi:hypothetical protein